MILAHYFRSQPDECENVEQCRQTVSRPNSYVGDFGFSIVAPDILTYALKVCREAGPLPKVDEINMKLIVEHLFSDVAVDRADFEVGLLIPVGPILINLRAKPLSDKSEALTPKMFVRRPQTDAIEKGHPSALDNERALPNL